MPFPKWLFKKSAKKTIAPALGASIGTAAAEKIGADPLLGAAAGSAVVTFIWDFLKRKVFKF